MQIKQSLCSLELCPEGLVSGYFKGHRIQGVDNISPKWEAQKKTDGCNSSENASMVISERKWLVALQEKQNSRRFEAIEAITGSLYQTASAVLAHNTYLSLPSRHCATDMTTMWLYFLMLRA